MALGVVALLLVAGAGARIAGSSAPAPSWTDRGGAVDTASGALAGVRDAAAARVVEDSIRAAPLAPGERLDPNAASALQLERLPRVGPSLAARIVEWRTTRGSFRTLADLDAVPGVGPALLRDIAPLLSLAPAAGSAGGVVDVNAATAAELEALPGIGPALAERIVRHRGDHGVFRSMDDLDAVPGIGPALRARLAPGLRFGP